MWCLQASALPLLPQCCVAPVDVPLVHPVSREGYEAEDPLSWDHTRDSSELLNIHTGNTYTLGDSLKHINPMLLGLKIPQVNPWNLSDFLIFFFLISMRLGFDSIAAPFL